MELSQISSGSGVLGLFKLQTLFDWRLTSIAHKLASLENLGYAIFLVGILLSFKKGLALMHLCFNTFFVLRVFDSLHCINSYTGQGIFSYLNFSNSGTSLFGYPDKVLNGEFQKFNLDSPFYRPTGNSRLIHTNGIAILALHCDKLEFFVLVLVTSI